MELHLASDALMFVKSNCRNEITCRLVKNRIYMKHVTLLICLFLALGAPAQTQQTANEEYNLDFEKQSGSLPDKWYSYHDQKGYKIVTDSTVKRTGNRSMLIEKINPLHENIYGQSNLVIQSKYLGKELEISAYMKLESVSNFVSLILATDDEDFDRVDFATMQHDKIKGTRDWKQYKIKIPLSPKARYIRIWPTLSGSGKLWIDGMSIRIDGKDIDQAQLKPNFNPVHKPYIPYGNNPAAGAFIPIKDAKIYYESYGQGAPLLLLHGNSQSIVAMKKQIIDLSKRYRVIAVDTRGQGKSIDQSDAPFSYDQFAEDMKAVLDSLNINKTHVYGWSDGGNTALIMAYKYPAYVDKVAVMGANMFPTTEAVSASTLKQVRKAIAGLEKKDDDQSKMQRKLFSLLISEPHITPEDLHKIQAPVLVMAGEKDMILDKHTRYIADNISKSQLTIFKNATHYAPVEIIPLFNERLTQFFEE